jgi:hypothetical protein
MLLHHGSLGDEESDEINDSLNDFKHETPLAIPLPPSLDTHTVSDGDESNEGDLAQIAEAGEAYMLNAEIRDLVSLLRIFYLLCQGLFAGFCFSTIYYSINAQSSGGDEQYYQFISTYCATSQEHRRLCFLFAVISSVGALDALLQCLSVRKAQLQASAHLNSHASPQQGQSDANHSFQRQLPPTSIFLKEFFYSVVGAVVHFVALIVTLVMSIADVRIATR